MKQFMQLVTGKAYLLLASLLIVVHVAASAAPPTGPDSPANKVTVKHIGNSDNNMYFKVEMDNPTGDKFSIVVKDQEGNVLFHNFYNDKAFNKTFQLTKEETSKVTFIIRSPKGTNAQSFEINTNTRVIDEVVVKRL